MNKIFLSILIIGLLLIIGVSKVSAACRLDFIHYGSGGACDWYPSCGGVCSDLFPSYFWMTCVECDSGGTCIQWRCTHYDCDNAGECCGGGGGCFTPDTPIDTPEGEVEIGGVEVGDEVASFNAETGEESTSVVEKIYEATRAAYYKIKTTDGKEVKVTAEHPLYAKQQEVKPMSFWEYLKTESLTSRVVGGLFQ